MFHKNTPVMVWFYTSHKRQRWNRGEVPLLKLSLEAETHRRAGISPLLQIYFPGLYLIEQASLNYVSHHSLPRLGLRAQVSCQRLLAALSLFFIQALYLLSHKPISCLPSTTTFLFFFLSLSPAFTTHRSLVSRLLSPSCLKPFPNISRVSVASCDWCICDYSFWQTCLCTGKNMKYLQKTAACEEVYGQWEEKEPVLFLFFLISEAQSVSKGQVFGLLSPTPAHHVGPAPLTPLASSLLAPSTLAYGPLELYLISFC